MAGEDSDGELPQRAQTGLPPSASRSLRLLSEDEVTEVLGEAAPPPAGTGSTARPDSAAQSAGRPEIRVIAGALIVVLVAALLGVALVRYFVRSPGGSRAARPQNQAAAVEQAASWVVHQVSRDSGVACDPVMCAALRARGFPARDLLVLGPRSQNPVGSDVVVETPAVLSLFGSSLATAWASAVLASFGSGPGTITVRVMASNGATAYQTLLNIDLMDRKSAGAGLLNDPQIKGPAAAGAQLTAGAVDSRLLLALAALAGHQPISIVRFGDAGPGAGPGVPFRSVDLAEDDPSAHLGRAAYVKSVRACLSTADSKFRPASMTTVVLAGGQAVLRVGFTAPSPLGLFSANSSGR